MKGPPHPGELMRTAVIESSRTYPGEFGGSLTVRRATLSELLHGKASLTPEMAQRIEKAFGPDGITMDDLLRMQLAYNVAKTRQQAPGISVQRYAPA